MGALLNKFASDTYGEDLRVGTLSDNVFMGIFAFFLFIMRLSCFWNEPTQWSIQDGDSKFECCRELNWAKVAFAVSGLFVVPRCIGTLRSIRLATNTS